MYEMNNILRTPRMSPERIKKSSRILIVIEREVIKENLKVPEFVFVFLNSLANGEKWNR